jgi:sugar/nucleoside kinase (ribokinase family)
MSKTILAIGGIYVDINCHGVNFKGSLPAEVELDGAEYEVVAGGSGVNFGRLCKQLGLHPAFIGKVGDDRMGELVKQLLHDAGIRPMLVVDNTVTTQIGMSFVNDQGETVMPGGGNANQALGPDDVIKEVREHAPKTDYLYLGTC